MSERRAEIIQTPFSMKPYISFMENTRRKFPYRVMGYDTKRNRWFVWDCFKTIALAETGLKRAMKQYEWNK